MTKGLLMVFTGNGKGKTTAAFGMALRSAGHGLKVCIIQFIKGSWKYGELDGFKRLEPEVEIKVMGRGFTWKSDDLDKDRALALEGWEMAKEAIGSGRYHLVILDEFTYLVKYGMVDLEPVLEAFRQKPETVHVAVTGRDAPQELMDLADLVTEMRQIKHPYQDAGIKAQKGIEF